MKTQMKMMWATSVVTVASLAWVTSAMADPPMLPPPPPPVTVVTPVPQPPSVTVQIGVPDYYAWDGYEYVGVIGSDYFYLGPGEVWLPLPPERWEHFHHWEGLHHDWREHAIRNERYRHDAHGHDYPWHERDEHHEHHHGHD